MNNKVSKVAKSTGLTCSTLEQEGIKTSLNQNDVTEIIAQQKYDEIQALIESAPKRSDYFPDKEDEENKIKQDFLKQLLKEKLITEDMINDTKSYSLVLAYDKGYSGNQYVITKGLLVTETKNDSVLNIQSANSYIPVGNHSVTISFTYNYPRLVDNNVKKGIERVTNSSVYYHKKSTIKFNTEKEIKAKVEEFNNKVIAIYKSIPVVEKKNSKSIGIDSLARLARVTINSNIIKNQSPQLTTQLKALFNVEL